MINYIVNFGDSWAHAVSAKSEVTKTDGYSYLMAKDLGVQWLDYSITSSSSGRLVLQLQDFLKSKYDPSNDYIALFFVTAQERQLMFDENENPIEVHPQTHAEYYKKYYTDKLGNHNLNTTLIALQSMCNMYNIDDHYLLGWQLPTLWPEVNTNKFYDYGRSCAINMFAGPGANLINMMTASDPHLISNVDGHPNKKGHQVIKNEWLRWIRQQHPKLDQ